MTRNLYLGGAALLLLGACGPDADAPEEGATPPETVTDEAAGDTAEAPTDDSGPVELAEPTGVTAQESAAWLADNAERPEVQVTETGLQYEVLEEGPEGAPSPTPQGWVCVHYTGSLIDGTVFDSSVQSGRPPLAWPAGEFIDGWIEGLQLMSVGDRYRLYIPPELGYGSAGAGGVIPPNAALVFEMQLLDIIEPDSIPLTEEGMPEPDWDCSAVDSEVIDQPEATPGDEPVEPEPEN